MKDNAYQHPRDIWLQPWCDYCRECSAVTGEGRLWCEDDVFGKCEQCGRKAIHYVMSRQEPAETSGKA